MIRLSIIACVATCLLVSPAWSQKNEPAERATYDVTLTEFQMKSGQEPEISFKEIIDAFHDRENRDNLILVETLRLTLQADLECTAQFSRQVTVTEGIVRNPRGVQRRTKTVKLGTMAQIRVTPEDDKLTLRLRYTASRLGGEIPEDSPPDMLNSTYETTIAVQRGKPALVGGGDVDGSSYLMVYVR